MIAMRYLPDVATLKLDSERCTACGLCTEVCPHGVLVLADGALQIDELDRCMECGACARNCPIEALTVKAGVGCASAIIHSWLTGEEPSCDCGGGSSCC